jgi:O-antigen/teichoic acid export membrane protein
MDQTLNYFREKWQHTGFQRYLANTGWLFASRVFVLLVSFVINIYIARYLGPNNYGLLNYTFSFVGLFGFLASLGIENVLSREIIKNPEKKEEIIGTAFFLKLGGSLLAIIFTLLIVKLTTTDYLVLTLVSIYCGVYIFNSFGVIDTYFQSQVLSKYPTIIAIGAGIISAILKIIVLIEGAGILWLISIYTFESIVSGLGLIYIFYRTGHRLMYWRFNQAMARGILHDSLPLMLSGVAVTIYMDIDQVLIKNMLGNREAGIYAVAVKLSEFWSFIPGIIAGSLFPALVNAKRVSQELFENRMKKLYFFMFWFASSIAFITTTFAPLIVGILYGNQYLGAILPLQIYVWGQVAISIGFVLSQYLVTENYTRVSAISTVIGAVLNIALNLILIPRYGITGAAIATLISYSTVVFSILIFKKTRHHLFVILQGIIPRLSL